MTHTGEQEQAEPGATQAPPPSLRGNRRFQLLFWAQALTDYCDQFLLVTLTWGALRQLGGPSLGLVLASWAIPRGVFLLLSGVFVDRWERRGVAVAVSLGLGCLAVAAAVITRFRELPAWMAIAAAIGVLDAFKLPIGASIQPMIVPEGQLVNANRWSSLREWSALSAGPAVGGVLVALAGVPLAFLVTAGMYGASGVLMIFLPRLRAESGDAPRGILGELRSGFALVIGHPRLRVLLPVFAAANLFVLGLIGVAIPVLVRERLNAGPSGLGFLSACFGAGLVIGTLACNRLPARWRDSDPAIFTLFAVSDGLLAAVGAAPNLALACTAYLASGLAAGPPATFYRTLLQTLPPPDYLGRVNSLARATSFGLEPVSTTAVGALSARIPPSLLLLGGGLAALCADITGARLSRRTARRALPCQR